MSSDREEEQPTQVESQETSSVGTGSHSVMSGSSGKVDEEKKSLNEGDEDYVPPAEMPVKPFSEYMFTFMCVLMIGFGGFIFGWDTGTVGGFVNMPNWVKRMGERHKDGTHYLSTVRKGLLISIINIGAAFGGPTIGRTADMYGRKLGLIFVVIVYIVYIVGIVICISVHNKWYQYFIGRIIEGLGLGGVAVISPMMVAEVSPKHLRGALVTCYQLLNCCALFLGYCTVYGTHKYKSDAQWRLPLGLSFIWSVLIIIGMTFVPESPRYLLEKDRIDEAKASIARSNKLSVDDPSVTAEAELIMASIEAERAAGTASWGEIFSTKTKVLQRLIMVCILQSLQQLTGDNYFFYYGTTIFKSVGLKDSFETSIILGVIIFAFTFVATYTTDRFGRRPSLLFGSAWLAMCLVIFASVGVKKLYPDGYHGSNSRTSKRAGNVMIAFTCLYLVVFAPTWGPLIYVVNAETFPIRVKGKCMAIAQSFNWLWGFLIGFFTPMITKKIRFAYGYVFLGCVVFSFFYVFFFMPETKGLTLEDVDTMWQEGVLPWKSTSWIPPSKRGADYDAEELANDDRPLWKRLL